MALRLRFGKRRRLVGYLIISYFFGGYAAGVFGIIDRVVQPIKQIIMPIVNIIYPKVCSILTIDRDRAIHLSVKSSIFITVLCALFLLFNLTFIEHIVHYVFKGSVEAKYLYPMIFNIFCVYISQVFVFLFIVPLGKGGFLKNIYAGMLVFFLMAISVSIYFKSLVLVYWVLASVELLGMLLLFYISYFSIKKISVL